MAKTLDLLEAFLAKVKAMLPKDLFDKLHLVARGVAGGKAYPPKPELQEKLAGVRLHLLPDGRLGVVKAGERLTVSLAEDGSLRLVCIAKAADQDVRSILQAALNTKYPAGRDEPGPWVREIPAPAEGEMVYERDGENFLSHYKITDAGVEFSNEREARQIWMEKAEISQRSWADIDKTKLPRSSFLINDSKNRSEWKLPVYEGAGEKDEEGRFTKRGPLNANAVRAALAMVGGARTGKPMNISAALRSRLDALAEQAGIKHVEKETDSKGEEGDTDGEPIAKIYESIGDLPKSMQSLPTHAKEIMLAAFNAALKQYEDEGRAWAVAWAAVKRKYEQKDGKWVAKLEASEKSIVIPILKASEEKHIVYGIVAEADDEVIDGWIEKGQPEDEMPELVDTQGDWYREEELETACHGFLAKWRNLGRQHKKLLKDSDVVQCAVLQKGALWPDADSEPLRYKSWVVAAKVMDDEAWRAIKKGELSGFSLGGYAVRHD